MLPTVKLLLKFTLSGEPNFPFLVVITITPLLALAPQIEVADASFKTETLSTSFGLMLLISPSYGKLSTTIKGPESAKIVENPRMDTGLFEISRLSNSTDGTMPSKRSIIFVDTLLSKTSELIISKDPVARSFGRLWYPVVTTTSAIDTSSGINSTIT